MVEQFCKSILQIETGNSKSLANLVMGLSSEPLARSVAAISLSACYHYQYSSINKSIDGLDKKIKKKRAIKGGEEEGKLSRLEVEKKFTYQGRLFFKTV